MRSIIALSLVVSSVAFGQESFWDKEVRKTETANRQYAEAFDQVYGSWITKFKNKWNKDAEEARRLNERDLKQAVEFWGPVFSEAVQNYQNKAETREAYQLMTNVYAGAESFVNYVLLLDKPAARYTRPVPYAYKKFLDDYMTWSLSRMRDLNSEIGDWLPSEIQNHIQMLGDAMFPTKDKVFQGRLDRLFKKVINNNYDKELRKCSKVIGLDADLVNAFNTGCTTYVTRATANKLNDYELMAVMAHEVSHADEGHAVKSMGFQFTTMGSHFGDLFKEEVKWFMTGEIGPHLQNVFKEGHFSTWLHNFGKLAVGVEIEADSGGAKILQKMKMSPDYLKTALIKLSGFEDESEVPREMNDSNGIRDYPSLYRRIQNIDRLK